MAAANSALATVQIAEVSIQMNAKHLMFDPAIFFAQAGLGRRIVGLKPKQVFFSQGTPADSVFYLQKGRAKLTVVSVRGKLATITLLAAVDFVGEEAMAGAMGSSTGDRHGHHGLHDA